MNTDEFAGGLAALVTIMEGNDAGTAYMCAEGNPRECHRWLISDALLAEGWEVVHLNRPGERFAHPGGGTGKENGE